MVKLKTELEASRPLITALNLRDWLWVQGVFKERQGDVMKTLLIAAFVGLLVVPVVGNAQTDPFGPRLDHNDHGTSRFHSHQHSE